MADVLHPVIALVGNDCDLADGDGLGRGYHGDGHTWVCDCMYACRWACVVSVTGAIVSQVSFILPPGGSRGPGDVLVELLKHVRDVTIDLRNLEMHMLSDNTVNSGEHWRQVEEGTHAEGLFTACSKKK